MCGKGVVRRQQHDGIDDGGGQHECDGQPHRHAFLIRALVMGMMAHMHTGKISPSNEANTIRSTLFFGIILRIVSSDTNTCIRADIIVTSRRKGKSLHLYGP